MHIAAKENVHLNSAKYGLVNPDLSDKQRRIVAEVERRLSVVREVKRRLSVAREVESAVEAGLARAARLRQAVLRSAFEGKL